MRKIVLSAIFAAVSLACNAQFVLTPSAGLVTEDGAYTIVREGTESENYYAAKSAVESAISGAEIGEVDYEKSFIASAAYKAHRKLPGALLATDWTIDYKIKVEVAEEKILISFDYIGSLVARKKNELITTVHPTTGKNSMLVDMTGNHYIFNSNGEVGKGCKKMKEQYEEIANGIIRDIENHLK